MNTDYKTAVIARGNAIDAGYNVAKVAETLISSGRITVDQVRDLVDGWADLLPFVCTYADDLTPKQYLDSVLMNIQYGIAPEGIPAGLLTAEGMVDDLLDVAGLTSADMYKQRWVTGADA